MIKGLSKETNLGCFVDNFIQSTVLIIFAPLKEMEFSFRCWCMYSIHLPFLDTFTQHLIMHKLYV